MWWDSTQITVLESVLFSIFTIAILYLVGFSFVKLFSIFGKLADPFSSFDFVQKITFRILFGLIFVVLFAVVFSFFGLSFFISTLLIILMGCLGLTVAFFGVKLRLPKGERFRKYALLIIIFGMFISVIFISSMLINGFYGSTNDDGADHTLMVRIVLDNPNVLLTRSGGSYASFLIRYPLGTHVLAAFFVTLLSVPVQKIVILLSAIFPALIALSFYSTVKCLFDNKVLALLSLIISGFFIFNLSLAPISWGGLPLLLSVWLLISSMGLFFTFLMKQKMSSLNAFLIGVVFLVVSQTYPVALLMMIFWFLLILSLKLFGKLGENRSYTFSITSIFKRSNILFFLSFLLPTFLALPYFYFLLTHNFDILQNTLITIVSQWVEPVKKSISFNWLFDVPALSLFFSRFGKLLALTPYSLIPLLILFVPKVSQRIDSVFPVKNFRRSILLIYVFMLIIFGYLTLTLYLPIDFLTAFFDPARIGQYIIVPGTILTAVVLFSAICFSYLVFNWLFHNNETADVKRMKRVSKKRILACMLLVSLILCGVFLINPIVTEQQDTFNKVRSNFDYYQTLKQDDVSLMKWISDNIQSNESILVSAGDSGQFLAAVTQHQVISINSRLANYSDLMALLTSNSSDSRAVPLMVKYNISYVYIGSTATIYGLQLAYYRAFNSTQFLSTPYFTLAKEVGSAWLFQFNASAASTAFEAAGPLPVFIDQWHPSEYINIFESEGGYTNPPAGIYYGSGKLAVYDLANEGYNLDHWMLNDSCLTGLKTQSTWTT